MGYVIILYYIMGLKAEKIIEKLQKNKTDLKKLGVRSLSLFGSFAKGKESSRSDLDFLVEFEKKTFDAYMELKFFLEELFGTSIDLVLPDALKKSLKPKIMKDRIRVQGL